MSRDRFLLLAALIVLGAFGIREWFVLTMTVPEPNQGDVGAYLRYALHLAWDGVFSQADGPAVPDAFRSPGYPWLLWSLFPGSWEDGRWYARIYQAQALLGAATVAGVIALARQWMSRGWALLAGLWMALQPHNIAATGAILVEVLLGACIVGALLCALLALRRRSLALSLLAGALFGLGYLVNPVLLFLPLLLLPFFWRDGQARNGIALALVAMLALGGWSARNAIVGVQGGDRAAMNFVQGSWPEYHELEKERRLPAIRQALDHEIAVLTADRPAGLRLVSDRLASDPLRYARWYLLEKPFLLWDWDIRIGKGTVYTVDQRATALDGGPLLLTTTAQRALNELLFVLAFAGIVLALMKGGPARIVALSVVYLTAVHVVLQAEPRYAIPYRGLEIALAFGVLAWLTELVRTRLNRRALASASIPPISR